MSTNPKIITRLALAEARAAGLDQELSDICEEAARQLLRLGEKLAAAEHRIDFAAEQLAVSRDFAEQRLREERVERVRAEATVEYACGVIRELRAELEEARR